MARYFNLEPSKKAYKPRWIAPSSAHEEISEGYFRLRRAGVEENQENGHMLQFGIKNRGIETNLVTCMADSLVTLAAIPAQPIADSATHTQACTATTKETR